MYESSNTSPEQNPTTSEHHYETSEILSAPQEALLTLVDDEPSVDYVHSIHLEQRAEQAQRLASEIIPNDIEGHVAAMSGTIYAYRRNAALQSNRGQYDLAA